MDDGWFAADFVMVHQIYGSLPWEKTWMCAIDMLKEVELGGPYNFLQNKEYIIHGGLQEGAQLSKKNLY